MIVELPTLLAPLPRATSETAEPIVGRATIRAGFSPNVPIGLGLFREPLLP